MAMKERGGGSERWKNGFLGTGERCIKYSGWRGGFDACSKREDGVRAGASFSPSHASNDSFFFPENC